LFVGENAHRTASREIINLKKRG